MYEYKIELNFKVENCLNCPFRHEFISSENVESMDKLSGITSITRRVSHCLLKNEPVLVNEIVEGYNSKCPLKGNILHIPDKD
jgi:hypothetical protein